MEIISYILLSISCVALIKAIFSMVNYKKEALNKTDNEGEENKLKLSILHSNLVFTKCIATMLQGGSCDEELHREISTFK